MISVLSNRKTVKRTRRYFVLLLTTMVLVSAAPLALGKIDLTELEFSHGISQPFSVAGVSNALCQ